MSGKNFTFEISLSILNHLGRNLYRSFVTVLGEAISNSWDADAKNVQIDIDRENNSFFIKDDGIGMTADDFQNKFLKIGYSKRREGSISPGGRSYIGRKGIGKLALLSCADKITVISKTKGGNYVGGVIDNSGLDKAITDDLTPKEYSLGEWKPDIFEQYTKDHERGTIIYFENIKDGIRNSLDFLNKTIALYFRFSLLDNSFNIFLDNEKITIKCLKELAQKTQFLWNINHLNDPYIKKMLTSLKEPGKAIEMDTNVKGFIASVSKPRYLKIITTDERIGVDLFVNGRLRERDISKHIPMSRLAENYFYGQIHFNDLDDEEDRFATGREGIIADDPKYKEFLDALKKKMSEILEDWDKWRIKHREVGDQESERIPEKERASLGLYNVVSREYDLLEDSENKRKVDGWVDELSEDAAFNFESYAGCFISENLVRKYIKGKNISPTTEQQEIDWWRNREVRKKRVGNLNIDIRQSNDDLFYLNMEHLVKVAEPPRDGFPDTLLTDEKQFTPIRDAVMHTSRLTNEAKTRLKSIYDNIKGRIKTLLSRKNTRT